MNHSKTVQRRGSALAPACMLQPQLHWQFSGAGGQLQHEPAPAPARARKRLWKLEVGSWVVDGERDREMAMDTGPGGCDVALLCGSVELVRDTLRLRPKPEPQPKPKPTTH